MTSFRRSQFVLSLFVWTMPVCWHSLPQCEVTSAINPHDLRSAFLLREGVVNYNGRTAAEHQAELRRHFDAVLAILELNTPQAIELALDRLETSRGEAWSPAERQQHREKLLASRELQLVRLRAYRDRGLFPQNEGHADHAVPIFVDNHDTACAVGHLMRLAGWEEEVAEIQAANNLVYVPDAADSSVAEWALTAGVTLEEAALIQPGYRGPPASLMLGDLLVPNASHTFDGIRISKLSASYMDLPASHYPMHQPSASLPCPYYFGCNMSPYPRVPVIPESLRPFIPFLPPEWFDFRDGPKPPSEIGFATGMGQFLSPDSYIDPEDPDYSNLLILQTSGTHWMHLGTSPEGWWGEPYGIAAHPEYQRMLHFRLAFQLEAVSENIELTSVSLHEEGIFGGFFGSFGNGDDREFDMYATVFSDELSDPLFFQYEVTSNGFLGTTHYNGLYSSSEISEVSFAPRDSVYVLVDAIIANPTGSDYFRNGFDTFTIGLGTATIPEPGSLALLLCATGLVLTMRRSKSH